MKFLTAGGKILARAWGAAIILFVFTLSAVLSAPLYLGLVVYQGLEHTVRTLWDTAENEGWLEAYQELLSNAKKAVQYIIKRKPQ